MMATDFVTHGVSMTLKKFLPILVLSAAVGCAGTDITKAPTNSHAELNNQWNAARAAVQASLATEQYKNGNLDDARKSIDGAIALNPKNPGLHVISAKIAMEKGQLDRAESELRLVQFQDVNNAEADYLLGVVYQRWQKPQQALELYQSASNKSQTELAYVLASAEMMVELNQSSEALTFLQSKMDQFEHSAPIRDAAGQLLVGAKQYAQAIDFLRQASMLATDDLTIKDHLAMALYFNKNYREASDLLAKLVTNEQYSQRVDLHLALGNCYEQMNRTDEAKESFQTATTISPGTPEAWQSLGKVSLEKNDYRRAEMALRKAASLDPASGETQLLMGYIRLRQNRLTEALPYFKKAAALDQQDTVSLCMVGYVNEKTGRTNEAIQCYARALKIHPGDELATKLMASIDAN
jgi:tetratricopeptide (TPR) repeat protein